MSKGMSMQLTVVLRLATFKNLTLLAGDDDIARGDMASDILEKGIKAAYRRYLKKHNQELTPGEKAHRVILWWKGVYKEKKGEAYIGKEAADAHFLSRLLARLDGVPSSQVMARLQAFLDDKDPFLVRQGHQLTHFKWNAYSPEAIMLAKGKRR